MTRHRLPESTSIALGWLIAALVAGPGTAGEHRGVVIVEAKPRGAMARGGILAGDRVLSCHGSGLGGSLQAPFDLLECEWELEPRGPVTVTVAREDQLMELVIPAGEWQAKARPGFDAEGEALWELGLAQIEQGALPPPAWDQLITRLDQADQQASALWLVAEGAHRLQATRRFEEAAREIGRALSRANTEGSPDLELAALWAQRQLLEARQASALINLQNAERLLDTVQRRAKADPTRQRPLVECVMRYHVGWHLTMAQRLEEAEGAFIAALDRVRAILPADSSLQGRLEGYLANVALTAGDLDLAKSRAEQAIATFEKIQPESRIQAWNYGVLGMTERRRGQLIASIAAYKDQITIYRRLGLEGNIVYPLHNIGIAAERLGDFPRAEAALVEALEIEEREHGLESSMAASLLGQRGYLHLSWGRLGTAEQYNRQSHRLLEQQGAHGGALARSHARLGHVARYRGNLDGAEKHYLRALSIYEGTGDVAGIGAHLSNLGNLARQRKDYEAALALYTRALHNIESGPRSSFETSRPRILSNLGRTHLLLGRPDDAEPFLRESLEIKRRESAETLDVAASLMLLGDLERSREKLDRADREYRAALALHSKLVPGRPAEAENQIRLGQLLLDRGDLAAAEPLLAKAVATTESRASGTALDADALYHLARWQTRHGHAKPALALYRRAVEALEIQWQKLGGSRDARLSWMHAHADYYRAFLELLVEEGRDEEAFDLLQRFRARGLRDILAQRDLDLPRDARAQASLNQLVDLARERESLLDKLDTDLPADEVGILRASIAGLRTRRERLLAELRIAAPELARLNYPTALTFREVGSALDLGTVLVSFSVGRDRTLAFVLHHRESRGVDLEVKRLAVGRATLGERVAAFRRSIERRLPGEVEAIQALGTELYERLLAPMATELEGAERILVAPDGPLHALPFAALRRDGRYLIDWKPIHLAPSATVYAELARQTISGRKAVAFGDPTFDGSAPNATVRGTELKRLPGTRREVDAFRRALPPPVETFIGRQATEGRVKQLKDERLIHLASHALVNQGLPLESALALARSPTSEDRENGLLHAWEVIEQMRLSASLVTLSACETALGREVEGEGILGLVWAFHYAGAKSVIASLWNVEDRSTSHLMADLYHGLAAGLTKDQALSRAQLRQIQTSSPTESSAARGVGGLVPKGSLTTAHPFYWAAFQLYGSIHD